MAQQVLSRILLVVVSIFGAGSTDTAISWRCWALKSRYLLSSCMINVFIIIIIIIIIILI